MGKNKKGGDETIKRWINEQMKGKSVVIVLIGSKTAGRKWIKYEIQRGWELEKGVLGIYIHNLKDKDGNQSSKGRNPFDDFTLNGVKLSKIVKAYNPPYTTSSYVYNYIKENLADWVEKAIEIRNQYE